MLGPKGYLRSSLRAGRSMLLASFVLSALSATTARAALVVEIQPASVSVAAGSTGNTLEVWLVNDPNDPTGPFTLSGFNVTLTISPASGVTFTSGDTSTTPPYLLAGNSVGFLFNPVTNDISDTADDLMQPVAENTTYGLGRLFFDVDPGATPGTYALSIDLVASSLVGGPPDFDLLDFTAVDGQIIVTQAAVVPEPSTIALAGIGLTAGGLVAWRRRRRPVV